VGIVDWHVDRADLGVADKLISLSENLKLQRGIVEFPGEAIFAVDFGEKGLEVFGGVKIPEGLHESISPQLCQCAQVAETRRAELERA